MNNKEKTIQEIKDIYYKEHGEMPSEERANNAYELINIFADKIFDDWIKEKNQDEE